MSDYDNDLLRRAIIHYKAGEMGTARKYLERALIAADDYETRLEASFLMSEIETDPAHKRSYLEDVLSIDRLHARARRALAILDGKLKPDEIVNPDSLPAPSTDPVTGQAQRFTCPTCGGRMTFAPDGRTLTCEYCERNQSITNPNDGDETKDFILAMATGHGHRAPVATRVFACQGCGADFVLPPQVISTLCAYCGSAHVVEMDERQLLEPDAVVPMTFNQRQAARHLVNWVQTNKIEPQGKVHVPRGFYLPVWSFNIYGDVPWSGVIYRRKQVVPISGVRPVAAQHVLAPAAQKIPPFFKRVLEKFDSHTLRDYDPRYLAGWPAEVYAISMSNASLIAREKAVKHELRLLKAQHPNMANFKADTTNLAIESFQLILIPVWYTEYPYEGRLLPVLIDGSSGATYGETPERGFKDWLGNILGLDDDQ